MKGILIKNGVFIITTIDYANKCYCISQNISRFGVPIVLFGDPPSFSYFSLLGFLLFPVEIPKGINLSTLG